MLISIVFRFRTVFVSDLHLGFRGTRAEEFAAFLKRVECERLYLVGDIVDMWVLRQRWRWPATHNQVARRLLKLAKRGTRVIYVPGNHDESLRPYAGIDLAGIRIATQAVHRLADGRRVLVCHGDEYDLVVQNSKLLSLVGTWAYDYLVALNVGVNRVRAVFG
ncbi:MAG: UDP-2,3-diacylglucosamine diphosphatase, partial [Phycisphaerales bacterium]